MTETTGNCRAHIIFAGESLDCELASGHLLPHEAERRDGTPHEWDTFGSSGGAVSS